MITEDDIAKAFDRVARSADGALIYAHFQKIMMGVVAGPDPSDGALRRNEGRRSLAAELMGLMAKGIDESAGRSDDTTGNERRPSERPVVFAIRQPASISRRESFRDYAARHDPELGGTRRDGD